MKKSIIIGTVIGDLTVTKYLGSKKYNNTYLCTCSCGNTREVKLTHLLSNTVTNCGCKNFVSKSHGNKKFNPAMASFRAKAANYKTLARKRGIEYALTYEEAISLLQGNCYYCDSKPSNEYNARKRNRVNTKNKINYAANNSDEYTIYYNGIDRVDNSKGYIPGNVVSCCTTCNTAKLTSSFSEFKDWINKVYNKLFKKEP